jgi:DNA repair ATPase RecN
MELNELKAKAFDLLSLKEKYIVAIDQINKEIQSILVEIKKLENDNP